MGKRVKAKSRAQRVTCKAFHRRRSHGGPSESRTTLPVWVTSWLDVVL